MIPFASRHLCTKPKQLFWLAGLIVVSHSGSTLAAEESLKFAGIPFSPGSIVKADVPLSAQEKSLAAQGGNVVPPNGVAVLATPPKFVPPVISSVRIEMIWSSFIAASAFMKGGCFWPEMAGRTRATTQPHGVAQ